MTCRELVAQAGGPAGDVAVDVAVAVPVGAAGAVAVAVTVVVVDVAGALDDEEHPAAPAQINATAIQLPGRQASRPAPRLSSRELIARPLLCRALCATPSL